MFIVINAMVSLATCKGVSEAAYINRSSYTAVIAWTPHQRNDIQGGVQY
jgi:hypothetical protein